jgi:hypothetical protein
MSAEAIQEMPSFDDALKQFHAFIVQQGLPPDLLWVFREDVSFDGQRILIKEPLPSDNVRLVESFYERGCRRGVGVLLTVLCLLDSHSCCYIWLPEDEIEAIESLTAGLKLSVPTSPASAESIKGWFGWQLYNWLGRRSGLNPLVERLPRRAI